MNEWDGYWSEKKEVSNFLFDRIALLYRRYIIPGILRHFLNKHYRKGAFLLHAGCGSGKVDECAKVDGMFKIISLDLSKVALQINSTNSVRIQGDIFDLPFKTGSVDGIYNLGVMEHFNEEGIGRILREFNRVLKPEGKIVLFWPPEFGLSVVFLKCVHFIANNILKKNIKLHPDEISRVKSYSHAESLCGKADFRIADYYFGPKDIFTYAVVTLEKK